MFAFDGMAVKMQILADGWQWLGLADGSAGLEKFGQGFLAGWVRVVSSGIPNPQGTDRS
jgi:hypothetical protein